MDDKELMDAAMSPEPVEDRPRDEKGRFAPKEPEPEKAPEPVAQAQPEPVKAEPEPTPKAEQPADEGAVPPWRLREMREERDALKRQLDEQRQDFLRQMQTFNQPKQEPQPVPDLYENPTAFVDHGVRQALDPVMQRLQQTQETYSKRFAVMQHGEEKVKAAYDAIAQGLAQRDPEAHQVYQRAMQSMDPYGDIVTWHTQKTVYSQIGNDPEAWFEKRMAEKLKDPAFASKALQQIQGSTTSTSQKPNVQLPPSLNKATGANVSSEPDNDLSDQGLYNYATAKRGR